MSEQYSHDEEEQYYSCAEVRSDVEDTEVLRNLLKIWRGDFEKNGASNTKEDKADGRRWSSDKAAAKVLCVTAEVRGRVTLGHRSPNWHINSYHYSKEPVCSLSQKGVVAGGGEKPR